MARRVAGAVAAVALTGTLALVLLARTEQEAPTPRAAPGAPTILSPQQDPRAPAQRSDGRAVRGPFGARLTRRVLLRARPGGRILRPIGLRTEFGSQRVLAVVERKRGWLGVLTHHVGNSRTAWIPAAGVRLVREPYTLQVDLSARRLVVRRESRVARRITIAIGRPETTTPTGRFAVTDVLAVGGAASPYGCCVLALTGRQPNIPQGWTGGDRLAIHGTTNERTVGTAVSSGCLRARERDMRWLIANVPLGAPVRIRA